MGTLELIKYYTEKLRHEQLSDREEKELSGLLYSLKVI